MCYFPVNVTSESYMTLKNAINTYFTEKDVDDPVSLVEPVGSLFGPATQPGQRCMRRACECGIRAGYS